MLEQFHFIRPLWLLLIIPLIFIIIWLWRKVPTDHNSWQKVIDAHLLPHLLINVGQSQKSVALILLATAWLLTVFALAGPTWSSSLQSVYRSQEALILVLDISKTMDATDIKPSRLERAKYKILDILKRRQEGQTALIVFAARPHTMSPLTDDNATIAHIVHSLDTDLIPVQDKQTGLALAQAKQLLTTAKVGGEVLLITDELGYKEQSLVQASELKAQGYPVSVLAINKQNKLQKLAMAGGGNYVELTTDDEDLEILLKRKYFNNEGKVTDATHASWEEQGYWLILLIIPLAALAFRRGWLI